MVGLGVILHPWLHHLLRCLRVELGVLPHPGVAATCLGQTALVQTGQTFAVDRTIDDEHHIAVCSHYSFPGVPKRSNWKRSGVQQNSGRQKGKVHRICRSR